MDYQWFPGHMTKAMRQMKEDIKLIDLIIELLDARIPLSSRNPEIDNLGQNKARLVLLNKADLADEKQNNKWIEYFKKKGIVALKINSKNKQGIKEINNAVNIACKEKIERNLKRGIKNRPIRAMVVGIPNVGKSTFINAYAGKNCAKTGNKPGVTKGKQWIRLNKNLELLDTPGVLWPKFDDQVAALRLAATGAIAGDVFDSFEVVSALLKDLSVRSPEVLKEKYGIDNPEEDTLLMIEKVGRRRGSLLQGGAVDTARAQRAVLSDFRSGKLGRITLDGVPGDYYENQ